MRSDWRETEATVASVVKQSNQYATTYEAVLTYKVDGGYYATTVCGLKVYVQGEKLKIWYDPMDPDRNNMTQREKLKKWGYAVFFTGLVAMAISYIMHPEAK